MSNSIKKRVKKYNPNKNSAAMLSLEKAIYGKQGEAKMENVKQKIRLAVDNTTAKAKVAGKSVWSTTKRVAKEVREMLVENRVAAAILLSASLNPVATAVSVGVWFGVVGVAALVEDTDAALAHIRSFPADVKQAAREIAESAVAPFQKA